MNEKILEVPNTMQAAIECIDALEAGGVIRDHTARLLRYLYVRGWDDGLAELEPQELERELGLADGKLSDAVAELRIAELIEVRPTPAGAVVILIALTSPGRTGFWDLGWWKRVLVSGDEN